MSNMIKTIFYTIAAIAIVIFFGGLVLGFAIFIFISAFILWALGFAIPVTVTQYGIEEHRRYRWFKRIQ